DLVYEGEVIITSANGRVELGFDNGVTYALRGSESVTLNDHVFDDQPLEADNALLTDESEMQQIAQAIAGENSLDELLDETAAGLNGGAEGEGHSFVQLIRIAENLDPYSPQAG